MKKLNGSLDKIGNILSEDTEYMNRMDNRDKKIKKIASSDEVYNKWVEGTDPEILKVLGVTTEALKRAKGEERLDMLDKYAEAYDTETGEPWESEGYFGEDSNEDSDEEDTLADPEENIPDREGSGEGGLSDEEIHDKVREYFEKNPKPTDEEIHEAVSKGAEVRHWSTILNGNRVVFEAFKKEWDDILAYVKEQSEKQQK